MDNNQSVVGYEKVTVVGLAPRDALQNIPGDNWPSPPWTCNHVSYCYLKNEPTNAQQLAEKYNATLRTEEVRVDQQK